MLVSGLLDDILVDVDSCPEPLDFSKSLNQFGDDQIASSQAGVGDDGSPTRMPEESNEESTVVSEEDAAPVAAEEAGTVTAPQQREDAVPNAEQDEEDGVNEFPTSARLMTSLGFLETTVNMSLDRCQVTKMYERHLAFLAIEYVNGQRKQRDALTELVYGSVFDITNNCKEAKKETDALLLRLDNSVTRKRAVRMPPALSNRLSKGIVKAVNGMIESYLTYSATLQSLHGRDYSRKPNPNCDTNHIRALTQLGLLKESATRRGSP